MNKKTNEKVAKVVFVIGIVAAILLAITISFAISKCLVGYFQRDETEISNTEEVKETENKRGISSVIEDSLESNNISGKTKHIEEVVKESPVVEEEKIQQEGWTTTTLNVREEPNTDSSILDTLPFNTYIKYYEYDDEWAEITYDNGHAYISRDYISDEECDFVIYDVPKTRGFKSYMPYTAITNKKSKQYKLQQIASTGAYGIRVVDSRYLVAIGTAFNAEVGTYIDLILEDGFVIPCIVGDVKSPKHTESNNMVTSANGCVSEFIIDPNKLNDKVRKSGNVSLCDKNWDNPVASIVVYNKCV